MCTFALSAIEVVERTHVRPFRVVCLGADLLLVHDARSRQDLDQSRLIGMLFPPKKTRHDVRFLLRPWALAGWETAYSVIPVPSKRSMRKLSPARLLRPVLVGLIICEQSMSSAVS